MPIFSACSAVSSTPSEVLTPACGAAASALSSCDWHPQIEKTLMPIRICARRNARNPLLRAQRRSRESARRLLSTGIVPGCLPSAAECLVHTDECLQTRQPIQAVLLLRGVQGSLRVQHIDIVTGARLITQPRSFESMLTLLHALA